MNPAVLYRLIKLVVVNESQLYFKGAKHFHVLNTFIVCSDIRYILVPPSGAEEDWPFQ